MSYILDALRRADSERERGTIPGIHAQPVPLLPDEEPAQPRFSPWVWGAAALGVISVLGAALVWALTRPDAQPADLPANAPTPARGAAPAPQAATLPPAVPTLRLPSPMPSPSVVTAPAAAPAPPAAPALSAKAAAQRASAAAAAANSSRRMAASASAVPASRAAASGAAAEPESAPRIYAQHELPEEIRRSLPALVVNGSVYSKNPADRFLIINGQIVHEKDTVAPDVVLELIRQRSAVLNTRGYRFEISY